MYCKVVILLSLVYVASAQTTLTVTKNGNPLPNGTLKVTFTEGASSPAPNFNGTDQIIDITSSPSTVQLIIGALGDWMGIAGVPLNTSDCSTVQASAFIRPFQGSVGTNTPARLCIRMFQMSPPLFRGYYSGFLNIFALGAGSPTVTVPVQFNIFPEGALQLTQPFPVQFNQKEVTYDGTQPAPIQVNVFDSTAVISFPANCQNGNPCIADANATLKADVRDINGVAVPWLEPSFTDPITGLATTKSPALLKLNVTPSKIPTGTGAVTARVEVTSAVTQVSAIGHSSFTVKASPTPPVPLAGTMAHVASGGFWETMFTLVNTGATNAQASLNLFADSGSPLTLPVTIPPSTVPSQTASVTRTLAPNASVVIDTRASDTAPVQTGSAQLQTADKVRGFAIYRYNFTSAELPTEQEAVVPLETRSANSYILPFDHVGDASLGVAIANIAAQTVTVNVIIRDDTGAQIDIPTSFNLFSSTHNSFVLTTQYPITAGKRGTIEFNTAVAGQISVLGVRFTPPGIFTTIPALANVGAAGGSVPHLASGGGWKTTLVLVNTGATTAQAQARFFADNGAPLTLPVSFPQGGTAVQASQVDRTLAPQQSVLIETTGPDNGPTLQGSVQLATDGQVRGFAIFRYTIRGQEAKTKFQEASVPIEARGGAAYVIPYDHLNGIVTGLAISNASALAATVPVIFRDDAGAQIGTTLINLPANGHTAFLVADQYPVTANKRGTIEFLTPIGVQINMMAQRWYPIPKLTLTTLPPIEK